MFKELLLKLLLELLMKFIQDVLKRDPEKVSFAEVQEIVKSRRFKLFAEKHG